MGELHLDILVDRMKREFNVEANVGKPQVAYRETIKRKVENVSYTHKKQTGGSGQFAKVIISIEPTGDSVGGTGGYEFVNNVSGGRVPREYIPSVGAGAEDAMQFGVLAGYQMVDVKVTLEDGAYHDVDSLGARVQACRLDGFQGSRAQGQAGPARAGVRGGGDDAGHVPRHRHR